jgi:hypothetical protein
MKTGVSKPDLSKVDEVGWTDLMIGGSTPASSRVDWIESLRMVRPTVIDMALPRKQHLIKSTFY